MMLKTIFRFLIFILALSCSNNKPMEKVDISHIDLQGHRGARGLYPENTIPAFDAALEHKVTTLELDLAVTSDSVLIVSHEPWMSHEICLDAKGEEIPKSEEKGHNIFKMTFEQVQQYDCGSKPYPRFPQQNKMKVTKPKLVDLIRHVEKKTKDSPQEGVLFNIEIKTLPEGDDLFHPKPERFAELLLDVLEREGILHRTTIQSFDLRALSVTRELNSEVVLALLLEDASDLEQALDSLGFVPSILSPYYKTLSPKVLARAKELNMKVVPWTVNSVEEIKKLISLGVDGIISDYPNLYAEL